MKKLTWLFSAFAGVALIISGCDNGKQAGLDVEAGMAAAPATLTLVETYKTPKGTPVRIFTVQTETAGTPTAHLLLVVGDDKAEVTMANVGTINIAGTDSPQPYFIGGRFIVMAISVTDPSKAAMVRELEIDYRSIDPSVTEFPLDLVKKKISGKTINAPSLDTL